MINFIKIGGRLLVFSLFLFLLAPLNISHPAVAGDAPAVPTQKMEIEAKQLDQRAVILHDYLAKYDSPLQDHAQDFVDAADTYNVDWKLVPSIAGVESTFGKNIPGGYNGWGWGVYGDQAIYFTSWRSGIFTVTQGLRENYLNKGLTDPYQINYAYAASPAWGGHVSYFMNDLNRFAQTYTDTDRTKISLDSSGTDKNTAASSAKLSSGGKSRVSNLLTFAIRP